MTLTEKIKSVRRLTSTKNTLSTKNVTRTRLGLKLDLYGDRKVANH